MRAVTAGHRFTCVFTFRGHWHLLPVRADWEKGGGQENGNGNARYRTSIIKHHGAAEGSRARCHPKLTAKSYRLGCVDLIKPVPDKAVCSAVGGDSPLLPPTFYHHPPGGGPQGRYCPPWRRMEQNGERKAGRMQEALSLMCRVTWKLPHLYTACTIIRQVVFGGIHLFIVQPQCSWSIRNVNKQAFLREYLYAHHL